MTLYLKTLYLWALLYPPKLNSLLNLSGCVAAADRVCADPAADGADAHRGGRTEDETAREH